jgi:hypothetical protein
LRRFTSEIFDRKPTSTQSTFLIWASTISALGRADYQRQYEPILYGWPAGVRHYSAESLFGPIGRNRQPLPKNILALLSVTYAVFGRPRAALHYKAAKNLV